MNEWLVVGGIALAAWSGVPGLFYRRESATGERTALALLALATLAAGAGAARALLAPSHGSGLAPEARTSRSAGSVASASVRTTATAPGTSEVEPSSTWVRSVHAFAFNVEPSEGSDPSL
jgi:hypothetical protein